ncbi:Trp biosynthesis-associated membrane protein [Micromonospora siamensis]|uniref:Tryptophan-associated transmembrane protein (Trp_oprn_chp) n=1 Tax=Micromonospora siamensis TaxID=299152 RepID=A0A1C5JGQ7_9ACTN|nr:Trp biosynthesis-associated membrane protein [Micromonospora siamensis]SCG69742.1 Tryptophan-associated transmembrane protein (Trp_oprn_chp) [Micromonospora siamensis]
MTGAGPEPAGEPSRAGRRELTYAVLLSLAGAGLALYAATRTWTVELTDRPPLPPTRAVRTGAALLPWLPALAVVGLAGGGALLATRGAVRRALGALLGLLGLAVAAGGGYGLLAGFDGELSRQWPALCLVGGLLAAAGGGLTAVRGRHWPAMGARYERRPHDGGAPTAAGGGPVSGARTREAWDALDRGEDPTVS